MAFQEQRIAPYKLFLLLCLLFVCVASEFSSNLYARASFGVYRDQKRMKRSNMDLYTLLRGGSLAASPDDLKNDVDEGIDENDDEEEEEEEEEDEEVAPTISAQPVRLMVQTNLGNSVLDQQVELMAARTRNVASLKKSLSRLLPGRPPILGLELVSEGRVLDDETLVDELFDDEDDDDDDEQEESGTGKLLILNSVPPVDPKFATELVSKLRAHVEEDSETLSTEEIIDAYFLNQVAMSRNSMLLADPNVESSPLLRLEIQEQAKKLREQLKGQIPDQVWENSLKPSQRSHHMEEYRGQRYRSGKGGARTNLKKSIQHNMNINWGETIRNFVLFLFFGYFGGRNSLSRYLMLWGAPLCFILQARPVKMWSKILFYMMSNPPGIVLSLLPAPQQAILSFNMEKAYTALYATEAEKAEIASRFQHTNDEDEDEDEDDEEEEEEEESDDEEFESSEYDSDEDETDVE